MKTRVFSPGAALMAAALLCACQMDGGREIGAETVDPVYSVDVASLEHGSVTPLPASGTEGTEVKLIVNPDPGYKLGGVQWHSKSKSNLDGSNQTTVTQNSQYVYRLEMPEAGAWITAQFVAAGSSEYSVTLDSGNHGQLLATPVYGAAGTTVRLYSFIDSGYAFKEGYPSLTGATWVAGKEGYEFTITGGSNVTVSALFEKPTSAAAVIASARAAMDAEEYDAAFGYYENAYQVDKTDDEAIFYSTIGELLDIAIDSRVRVLLRKPGMVSTSTPGTLNDLLDFDTGKSTNWLATYTDDAGTTYKLPRLGAPTKVGLPNGFPSAFLNYDIYQKNVGKRRIFDVLLFWNMVANNLDGFNDFVDDALEYVFGDQFEDACARAATISTGASVTLNSNLKAAFGLEDIYGTGSTTVGKAELDAIVSSLRAAKAAFEWAAAYNWSTDLRPLLVEVGNSDTFDDLLKKALKKVDARIVLEEGNVSLATILPFRNGLLTRRSDAMMYAARADLEKAVTLLDGSFAELYGRFAADAQAKYAWLAGDSGFVKALKAALDSGGVIYFPEVAQYKTLFDAMEGQGAWVTDAGASLGVDLGQLFTPGSLTMGRVIVAESSGKAPTFFGFSSGSSSGAAIASASEIAGYDTFRLKFGDGFKGVFVKAKGLETDAYSWVSDLYPDFFPQTGTTPVLTLAEQNVAKLYDLYQAR